MFYAKQHSQCIYERCFASKSLTELPCQTINRIPGNIVFKNQTETLTFTKFVVCILLSPRLRIRESNKINRIKKSPFHFQLKFFFLSPSVSAFLQLKKKMTKKEIWRGVPSSCPGTFNTAQRTARISLSWGRNKLAVVGIPVTQIRHSLNLS